MEKIISNSPIVYSIIIPHYNLSDKLYRLLSSIPKRQDVEIIVVDDCSTKGLDVLEDIRKDPNVNLIFAERNGGAGRARNIGIKEAKGEYLIFADADDFFLPSFNSLLDKYLNVKFDLLFFNSISLNEGTFSLANRNKILSSHFKDKSITGKNQLYFRYLFGEPWCKIIKKSLVLEKNLKYDEIPIHNDTYFAYQIGYFAEKIIADPLIAYCIINREESVSKQCEPDKIEIRLKVFTKKNKFLKDHNVPVFDPLLLQPFTSALKKFRFKLLKKYYSLVRAEGIGWKDIIVGMIRYKTNF